MSDSRKPSSDGDYTAAQGSLFSGHTDGKDDIAVPSTVAKRKLQLANGYLLEFDNVSRVLSASYEKRSLKKISRAALVESTGLPDSHVESLVSMAAAMGLMKPIVQTPTAFGSLVAQYDVFFGRQGTIEWCHYRGAGSVRNLVWFDVFNRVLVEQKPMAHPAWSTWFRAELAGRYSTRTVRKVVQEEVRFVIDAYLQQKFRSLGLIEEAPDHVLVPRRHREIDHFMLSAMVYDFVESQGGRTFEIAEFVRTPGSPAVVFALDAESMRALVEALHTEGLVRYETTHNLDQIRLIPGYGSQEFLKAYYEARPPHRNDAEGGMRG